MRDIIYSLPDQILNTIQLLSKIKSTKQYKRVIVCGMGGSGISGEIVRVLYPEVHIVTNNDYEVPAFIGEKTLAILISYSGNTEETLQNYITLAKRNTGIVIITSNGKLAKRKYDYRITVPKGLPPRGAIGYLFTPIPYVLYRYGLIHHDPLKKLHALATFLQEKKESIDKQARQIAAKLTMRLPVIYAQSQRFYVVARRWQCQFNENSKVLAHVNVFPEMNHNEIVGIGCPEAVHKHCALVLLHDPKAHPRNSLRVNIVKRIVKKSFSTVIDIKPEGKDHLQRMFWTIMLGDFISFYVALRTGVDPMPVQRIEQLKKKLAAVRKRKL
jgi:glucose/mannose-6-phosphate isomerase